MNVIVVDARDVRVGYNDIRQVSEGLDTVGEADGEEAQGKVGGREQ